MLFVHQLHDLVGCDGDAFETLVRDRYAPGLGAHGAQFLWFARALPDSLGPAEAATLFSVEDDTWPELATALDSGELAAVTRELDTARLGVTTRVGSMMRFAILSNDLAAGASSAPSGDDPCTYLHDFVTPQPDAFDPYDKAMDTAYRELAKTTLSSKPWCTLQVVPGGGTERECVIISRIENPQRFASVIVNGLPSNVPGPLGDWMRAGIDYRDTWTSRLMQAPSWSPWK